MSIETSIDALCREFDIEDKRADEKAKPTLPDPVEEVAAVEPEEPVAQDPMSFLEEETGELVHALPDEEEDENGGHGPSVADLKKKAQEESREITKLEAEVKLKTMTQRYDLEDKAYMKAQLKSLISDNRTVMDVIESQLKIGTNPHLFDTYATLSKVVADNVMRLAKIDQMVTDYKVVEDKGNGNIKQDVIKEQQEAAAAAGQGGGNTYIQNNLCFASDEILKLVKKVLPPQEKVKLEDLPKFDLS
jgi:hypothetical protein